MVIKILVPLDGSELAERALYYAEPMVVKKGAQVILMHVCGPDECQCEAEKCTVQPLHRVYIEETAERFKNKLKEEVSNGADVRWEILCGEPATNIINYAGTQDIHHIIMASHGRSGINRWILGSVADRVTRGSPVPVIIINASLEEIRQSGLPDKKILVLLDGSDTAEQVLPYAKEHAEMSSREVVLLRVCEQPNIEHPLIYHSMEWGYPPSRPLQWEDYAEQELIKRKEEVRAYLTGIEEKFTSVGIKVSSEVIVGRPAEAIVDYLAVMHFNLVVMSTHGRSGLTRWALGSVASRVLHATTSPVLLVRSRPETFF